MRQTHDEDIECNDCVGDVKQTICSEDEDVLGQASGWDDSVSGSHSNEINRFAAVENKKKENFRR